MINIKKISFCFILTASTLFASHNPNEEEHEHMGALESFLHNTSITKDYINDKLVRLSTNLDNYLTLTPNSKDINKKSKIHLELSSYKEESQNHEFKLKVKVKIKLPKLQDKLRLVIGNEDNQKGSSHNDYTNRTIKNDDYNVGLEYVSEKKYFRYNGSIGLNVSSGFDPYAKFKVYKTFNVYENIQSLIKQEFKYSYEEKLESRSSIKFYKELNEKFLISNYNEYEYKEEYHVNTIYNNIKLIHSISKKSYLSYVLASTFDDDNQDEIKHKEYQTYLDYRYYIRDWIYYDIIPKIIYENEDNYEPKYALRLNIGMFIGK